MSRIWIISITSVPSVTRFTPTHQVLKLVPEHRAAETVDEGVAAAVAHGEPVGDQEDDVDVLELVDNGLDHARQEVDLVGEPAQAENDHNCH